MKNQVLKVKESFSWEDFKNTDWANKYAANFGYDHLIQREFAGWDPYTPKVFIVEADPTINYGLDFQIYFFYEVGKSRAFKEFSFVHSLSNRNLYQATGLPFTSPEWVETIKFHYPEMKCDEITINYENGGFPNTPEMIKKLEGVVLY